MPDRPDVVWCGPLDVDAYWTGGPWRPDCCMAHVAAAEYREEMPEQLHPARRRVPTRTEPIPLEAKRLDGPMLEVLDAGALGGFPFAPSAAKRIGGVTMLDGEQTLNARDYRAFPWAYAIERRLAGHCRRRHVTRPELWPEHRGRPICPAVIRLVVARGFSPWHVATHTRIPPERLEHVLRDSLVWLWRRVSESLNEIELGRRKSPPV